VLRYKVLHFGGIVKNSKELITIANSIHMIRDQKVMLDRDLAELYGLMLRL
jgi:hypothetical protein